MMLYFVVFKNKKDKEYKLFTNTVFDKENEAEEFGKKSMKRNYEHKVLEYNSENLYIGIGYEKRNKISAINSVKVIVTPWQKGFTCGIIMDSKSKMSTEQYELCSTIARGMIKMATSDPHSTFLWGLRGFAEDKKRNDKDLTVSSIAEFDDESNVIDFLKYLKMKRDKELN